MLLQLNYVLSNNKTCLGLRVKCQLILPDLNQIWILSTQYQTSGKTIQKTASLIQANRRLS